MSSYKVSSTIRYSKPGTLPPIYVAGSFSSPVWEPQEMHYAANQAGEYEFYKEVEVEEGKEYQYKFRVGLGDWWVLNESSPTATDPAGNKNNVLNVQRQKESINNSENTIETSQLPPKAEGAQPVEIASKRTGPNQSNGETEDSVSANASAAKHSLANLDGASRMKKDATDDSDQLHESSSPNLTVVNGETKSAHDAGHDADGAAKKVQDPQIQVHDMTINPIGLRQQSYTPDIAAEVADSAAIIDREQPTPPVSDAEAGRIGLRRMSNTPIPEVAHTAAEVANTAATLDGEYFHASRDYEGGIGEWHVDFSLPESAKNLSLSERNELKREQAENEKIQNEELLRSPGAKILASRDQYHARVCKEADSFPRSQETDQIWKDILAAREVAVDEANRQGLRHTDLGDDNRELFGLARITSQLYWCKASQARAFPDGNDPQVEADIAEQEDRLAFYQYRAKIESGELVEHDQSSVDEYGENGRIASNEATTTEDIISNDSGSKNGSVDPKRSMTVRNHLNLNGSKAKSKDDDSGQRISSTESNAKEAAEIRPNAHGASEDAKEKPLNDSKRAHIDGADDNQENPLVEAYESPPYIPSTAVGDSLDGAQSQSGSTSVTAVTVGDTQLDRQDEGTSQEKLTGEDSTSTDIQRATSVVFSPEDEPLNSSEVSSKADATDNSENRLRKRKQQQSPAGDRPRTPTSIRSDGRDAKSKNFLKAFWRVLFVDWIGGFITRLCGRNRHKVLTIFALLLMTIGPAWYFSS